MQAKLVLTLVLIVATASCNCLNILDLFRVKRQLPPQPNEITGGENLMPPEGAQPIESGLQQDQLTTPTLPSGPQPEFGRQDQTEPPPPPARVEPPNPQRNGPRPSGNPPRMGNPQPQNGNNRRPPLTTAIPSASRSQQPRTGRPDPGRNPPVQTQRPPKPAENNGPDLQNPRRFPPLGRTQSTPRPGENNIPDAQNPGRLPPRLQPSGPNRSRFPEFRGQNPAQTTTPPPLAEELNPADNVDPESSGVGNSKERNDGDSVPEPTKTPRPPGRANPLPLENNGPRPQVNGNSWPRPINGTRNRPTPSPQPAPESEEAPDTFTEEGLLAALQANQNEVSDSDNNGEDEQPSSTNRPQPAQVSRRPPPQAGMLPGGSSNPGNQVSPDRNTGNGRHPSSSNGGNILPPRFVPRNNSQPANRNAPGGGNIPNGRGQPLGGNGGRQEQPDRQNIDAPRPADPDHSPNGNNHNQQDRPDNEDVDNIMNNDNIDSGSANDLGRSSSLAKPQPFTPPVPTNRNRTPNRQPANPTRSPLGSRPQTPPPRISGRPGIPLPQRQDGPFIRPLERTTAPPQAAQQGGGPLDEAFTELPQPTPRRPIIDSPSESTNDNGDGADLANSNSRPDQSDEARPTNVQPQPAAQFRPAPAPGRQDPAADRNVIPDSVRRDSTELDKPKQQPPQQAPRGGFSQKPPNASATPRPLPNSRLTGTQVPMPTRPPPVNGPQRRPGMPNRPPVNGDRQVNPDASNSNNDDNNIRDQPANPHNDPGSAASGDADSLPPGFARILNSNGQPQRNVANNARNEHPAPAPKDPFSEPGNENPENPDSWS